MGGDLKVESVLGEGSRFWFTLPLVQGHEERRVRQITDVETAVPPLDARLAPGERLTALVVDDSTANRHILAGLLESAGVSVITAAGGLEAIELARAHRPEIVFMDLKMNDLDGLEATRRLAQDPATATIPVIAVTASAFGECPAERSRRRMRRLPVQAGSCPVALRHAADPPRRAVCQRERSAVAGRPRPDRFSIVASRSRPGFATRSRLATSATFRSWRGTSWRATPQRPPSASASTGWR